MLRRRCPPRQLVDFLDNALTEVRASELKLERSSFMTTLRRPPSTTRTTRSSSPGPESMGVSPGAGDIRLCVPHWIKQVDGCSCCGRPTTMVLSRSDCLIWPGLPAVRPMQPHSHQSPGDLDTNFRSFSFSLQACLFNRLDSPDAKAVSLRCSLSRFYKRLPSQVGMAAVGGEAMAGDVALASQNRPSSWPQAAVRSEQ